MVDPKQTPKVMDVVHPSQVQPSATSRPVIVSNRPYMTNDPMLNANSNVDVVMGAPALAPALSEEVAEQEVLGESKAQDSVAVEKPEEPSIDPLAESELKSEVEPEPAMEEPHDIVEPEAAKLVEPIEGIAAEEPESELAEIGEDVPAEAIPDPRETEHANESGANAYDEEIERHIATGTYAVQINKRSRQRQKVWASVFLLLVVLIAADVLADINIISVPSWLPHTNLLAK